MIKIIKNDINMSLIPPSLYGQKPYRVIEQGLAISTSSKKEMEQLIGEFLVANRFNTEDVYLRLDLFVDANQQQLHLLEINSRLVDGWGASLNLARAAGHTVNCSGVNFPRWWHIPQNNLAYGAEFNLALAEVKNLGVEIAEVKNLSQVPRVYYYGWDRPLNIKCGLAPAYGFEAENKHRLVDFSEIWQGENVKIPQGYSIAKTPWEDIPQEQVIFKFVEKNSSDSQRAGKNVFYPDEIGKGRFAKQCYERGTLIAQDFVEPLEEKGGISQLVLLTAGATVVTGYVLWAPKGTRVITDAFWHGPLMWD